MTYMKYTSKFKEAFEFAFDRHDGQVRKGTELPYITHPMAVAAIAAEYGGDEQQVIAALLHDVIEDTETTAEEVQSLFGEKVAKIVVDLTDTDQTPKPPWKKRDLSTRR